MAISPKEYIQQFRDITRGYMVTRDQDPTVKFLRKTVDTLEGVLKKIDKFLKSKNIDVKEKAQEFSKKSKSVYGKGKEKLTSLKTEVGQQGVFGFLKNKATDAKTKISDAMRSDTERSAAPPDKQASESVFASLMEKIDKLGGTIADLAKSTNNVADTDQEKSQQEKENRLEGFKKSMDEKKAREDRRKQEIEDEKKREKKAKKPGENWLGRILGGIGTAAGFIGKSILGLAPRLGKLLFRGVAGLLTRVVPLMSGLVARGLSSVLGKTLTSVGGAALRFAGGAALGALKAAGTAVAAAATSTVGLVIGGVAVAGLLIYGGYKLYKYLNRNSIADDIAGKLTRLRLMLYGYNDTKRDHYYRLLELEMMCKDYVTYKDGRLVFKPFTGEFKEKILKLFEITRKDKEKYQILNTWFVKRFMPSFSAFTQAMMSVEPKIYLDDLDKLSKPQMLELVSKFIVPVDVFDIMSVPTFDSPETTVTKDQVDELLTNARNLAKKEAGDSNTNADKTIRKQNQDQAKKDEQAAKKEAEDRNNAKPIENKPVSKAPLPGMEANKPKDAKNTPTADQEGEDKPSIGNTGAAKAAETKMSGKVALASGERVTGNKALEGIIPNGTTKEKIYNLNPNVFELFTGMAKEYFDLTGKSIVVKDAFRSYEDQMAIARKYPDRAAKPGNSTHEFGVALDIDQKAADEMDTMGLMRKYGFTRPIGGEKWHIEPAGVALNPAAAKNDPASLLKRILSSPGRGGDGYGTVKGSILKKRDTAYQKQLFDQGSSEPIKLGQNQSKDQIPDQPGTPSSQPSSSGTGMPQQSSAQTTETKSFVSTGPTPQAAAAGVPVETGSGGKLLDSDGKPVTTAPGSVMPSSKPPVAPNAPQGLDKTLGDTYGASTNTDLGKYSPDMGPEAAIRQASKLNGMNPETMLAFAKIESSMNPNARSKASSATGLFQITDSTRDGLIKKHGSRLGVPQGASMTNAYYNALLGTAYAKDNLAAVGNYQQTGISEDVALYLAHHFGAGGARTIIEAYKKNPNAPISSAVSQSAYNANRQELGNKTIAQYIDYLKAKLQKAGATPSSSYAGSTSNSPSGSNSGTSGSSPSSSMVSQNNPQGPKQGQFSNSTPSTQGALGGPTPTVQISGDPMATPTPQPNVSASLQQERDRFNSPLYKDAPAPSTKMQSPFSNTTTPTAPLPAQPSPVNSMATTESLLSSQLDNLVQIKNLLEVISRQGSGVSNNSQTQQPSQPPQEQPSGPGRPSGAIDARQNNVPSQTSVSMSRRPIV